MTAGPPAVLDGPSSSVLSLGGLGVAPDGSGGLVYLKSAAGVAHVFASALTGGTFGAPAELDPGLANPSSQPVIAAGNGGLVVVAFVNGGGLYVVTKPNAFAPFSGPQLLAGGTSNPAISVSAYGKAYVAFTVGSGSGADVRSAYYAAGRWALESAPLDAAPGEGAGTGTSRPSVVAAGDGVAIVAWGEAGHVYARRVWGLSPSAAVARLDPGTVGGQAEGSADEPQVSAGGDSSYADIVYHETVGSSNQSRVLMSRLVASQLQPPVGVDGLSAASLPAGEDDPRIALGEYGSGFITSTRTDTDAVTAVHAYSNGALDITTSPVNALPESSTPFAVPGMSGLFSDQVAYQYDPGPLGVPDIRLRFSDNGSTLGPEQVLSSPAAGPADAADGLATAGDGRGDAAAAWVQGTAGNRSIVTDQLYWAPGGVTTSAPTGYVRTVQPNLSWTPAKVYWGPMRYAVSLDGRLIGATNGTSLTAPTAVPDGRHSFAVVAIDPAGVSAAPVSGSFFVDHLPPVVTLRITRTLEVGVHIHALGSVTDTAAPEVPGGSSGVAATAINFGDGSVYSGVRAKYHAYAKAGRYRITLVAVDRAGNVGAASVVVKIAPKPKPKPKKKKAKHTTAKQRAVRR